MPPAALFPQIFPLGFLENFKSDATPGIWQPAHLQTLCQKKGLLGSNAWLLVQGDRVQPLLPGS